MCFGLHCSLCYSRPLGKTPLWWWRHRSVVSLRDGTVAQLSGSLKEHSFSSSCVSEIIVSPDSIPHRPARSQSLYRLSYPANIYIYIFLWRCGPTQAMASSLLRVLDHTQRRITFGRTPLDEWSARRRDLHLTTHNAPVGFEPTISTGERP